jgi:hypothetical protein
MFHLAVFCGCQSNRLSTSADPINCENSRNAPGLKKQIRTRPCLRVSTNPARTRIRSCTCADGKKILNGSTNFDNDMAPPMASRESIFLRSGKPSASSIRRTFLCISPVEYVRDSSTCLFRRSRSLASSCRSRSRTRRILRGFQYLIIGLSMGMREEECNQQEGIGDAFENATVSIRAPSPENRRDALRTILLSLFR